MTVVCCRCWDREPAAWYPKVGAACWECAAAQWSDDQLCRACRNVWATADGLCEECRVGFELDERRERRT